MNTKHIFDFVSDIRRQLDALNQERESLPIQLSAAVRGSDAAEVRRLKARQLEVEQDIIDLSEDAQKRLKTFSDKERPGLHRAVQQADDAFQAARQHLQDVLAENVERERIARASMTDAEKAYNVTYGESRAASDELNALADQLKAEFARFAAA